MEADSDASCYRRNGTRRAFLIAGGLAIAGLAARDTSPQEPFDRLSDELTHSEKIYGEMGRAFRGKTASVVLAVRQGHKADEEQFLPGLTKLAEGVEKAVEELGQTTDGEERRRLTEQIRSLRKVGEKPVEEIISIARCQWQIYATLLRLVRELDEDFLVGTEGLLGGMEYDISDAQLNEVSFDQRGRPLLTEPEAVGFFYTYPACFVLKRVEGDRVKLVGLEDKELHEKTGKCERGSEEYRKLQVQRNERAAWYMGQTFKETGCRYGALVFGSNHFDVYTPTILDYLERKAQSYIEFIPRQVLKEKK